MRALWIAAPLALTRHAAVFAAVVVAVALAAAAAASTPLVRAGVQSESLKSHIRAMSPLAAGLEVRTAGSASTDRRRRAAAVRFGRSLPYAAQPVLTSSFTAAVAGSEGQGLEIVPLARTNALAHVVPLAGHDRTGVWVSSVAAGVAH